MIVAIVGANGKIGRIVADQMKAADAFEPIALVRSEEHAARFRGLRIEARLADLEGEFADALAGTDAVVFTAGSGAHTGKDKTLLVDLWGAVRVIKHCEASGPRRFVMISSKRAGDPDQSSGGIKPYLVAKWAADECLKASGLAFTILRPGPLTDDPGTGRIHTAHSPANGTGQIPREDVASCVLAALASDKTVGRTYDLLAGETPLGSVF